MSTTALRLEPLFDGPGFLAFLDERPDERWELLDGVPVAMVGGTRVHGQLAANLLEAVRPVARKRGCDAHGSFFVETPSGSFFEPDLLIDCGGGRPDARSTDRPMILFEVLSPSTMHFDRSEKARRYRAIPSLRQIVFVYQDSVRVESWSRDEDGWSHEPTVLIRLGDSLALPAIAGSLPLSAVYAHLSVPGVANE